jgi:segregation and condensation protein B
MLENEQSLIEAILFMESEPIDIKTISRISSLSKELIDKLLKEMAVHYEQTNHGIMLYDFEGAWQFLPKKQLWNQLSDRYGKRPDGKLSKAAIETLSIIAYSQPLTRNEIENIRGVSSDSLIRQLLARNLIHEVGKKDAPGKPAQYGTTKEFLRTFNLQSIADLPKLDELEKKRFESN